MINDAIPRSRQIDAGSGLLDLARPLENRVLDAALGYLRGWQESGNARKLAIHFFMRTQP